MAAPKATPAAKGKPSRRAAKPPAKKAPLTVFLDRDGVLNAAPRLVVLRWSRFRFLPGVPEALARLSSAGARTCLVTNQPTMGLLGTGPLVRRLHARMQDELRQAGAELDRIEAAASPFPHRRRKPNPGMLEDAAAAFAATGPPVDKARCVMVGDKLRDMQTAERHGIPGILVLTRPDSPRQRKASQQLGQPPLACVPDLAAAVELILARAA